MMDQLSLMHRREDEEEDHEEEDDDEDDGGFGLRSGSGGGGGDRALQRTLTRMIDMARGPKRGNPLRGVEDIQLPQVLAGPGGAFRLHIFVERGPLSRILVYAWWRRWGFASGGILGDMKET